MHTFLRNTVYFLLFVFSCQLQAVGPDALRDPTRKTVCLNMIVKDESKVITRCLESALPIIDTWVIVDTGSTDNTQNIIRDYMKEKGVPGILYERPWKNFAFNRNEAISLAKDKADFLLFIDADEIFVYEPNFKLPALNKDFYYLTINLDRIVKYDRIQMVNTKSDWKYVGALHEVLDIPPNNFGAHLDDMYIFSSHEGSRSEDPLKFHKDVKVLEEALAEEPDNARTVFYLAQSYAAAGDPQRSIDMYQKRVSMGGWDQEVYISLLRIARLKEGIKAPKSEVIDAYQQAFKYRQRAEPLYYLSTYYRVHDDFERAYKVAELGTKLPLSKDVLFVEYWIYEYGLPLELSVSAYWLGRYKESKEISEKILTQKDLPESIRQLVERNLAFSNEKLNEQILQEITSQAALQLEEITAEAH